VAIFSIDTIRLVTSTMDAEMASEGAASHSTGDMNQDEDEYARAQKSKFRFKSSKRRTDPAKEHRRQRHHSQHHSSKRRKTSEEPPDDPSLYDDTHLPNASSEQFLDPDTAFRESLFDAMADDEGAQFWEGVYGQPIPQIDPVKPGPTGELEAMTEDEYVAHVRAEMYKKTHQHLFEEKARREKAKKERDRLTEQARRQADEAERFRRMVEDSIRRGKERKDQAQRATEWARKWTEYKKSWEDLGDPNRSATAKIPWPVWRGTRDDLSKEEIEIFFLNAPTGGKPDQADLTRTLKAERVRWHPDKIQQKLGGQGVDEAKMRAVTAVFQIIDRIWSDMKDRAG
jgi:hypothetical protein